MISRKSSSQLSTLSATTTSSTSSIQSSKSPASAFTDWDADDEGAMSTEDYVPTRALSVAIPKAGGGQGPYCPRRPNLRDILANTSPAPWTLAAFMAYLSNNHCLETLEFTMDAGRYRKHYTKMLSRAGSNGTPPDKDMQYVQELWQRLVNAYIQPNGSREVNLPSDVRDPILTPEVGDLPPAPEKLDTAVAKIYELMEESVLVPFLNSAYPQTAHPSVASCPYDTSEESISRHYGGRSKASRGHRNVRSSPPPQSAVDPYAHSYSAPSAMNRKSAPSSFTASLNKARFSVKLSQSTSSPANPMSNSDYLGATSEANLSATGSGSDPGMTADSGSAGSPTGDSPMTPPASPPMSDASPKRDSGMWKKLGRLSGMKVGKKKSHGGLMEEQQSPPQQ